MTMPLAMPPSALIARLAEIIPQRYLASPEALADVARRWCERQRFWHGPQHLIAMIDEVARRPSGEERDTLLLAALYHDAVYNPRAADNEEASARLLQEHSADPTNPVIGQAIEIISASKWEQVPETSLGKSFFEMDTHQLSDGCPLAERLAYERAIFREFQWAPWPEYQAKRDAFLQEWAARFPQHQRGVYECRQLLSGLAPRVAVYPGSFHPFHLGHLSILRQAEHAFDKVIVAVGVNRQKLAAADSLELRHTELQSRLSFHEVAAFSDLLSEYLDGFDLPVTVVRGVRDGTDLEAELRFARFLDELRPGTRVIWISCEAELQHLSSSAIRELEAIRPGAGSRYVPGTQVIYDLGEKG